MVPGRCTESNEQLARDVSCLVFHSNRVFGIGAFFPIRSVDHFG